ncbi:DUF294 nucleotidyltransferase-like domain-containing protein [Cytobacillus gottheilii]|uniref:DUF294 nucleotidyltransferase-like domain-containing protein n=1 Tax=Cytobacillus gottheilii TaxID=859144 RepID=UPI0009BA6361|nr:DUF294 nucleotidyltransferase-like domain-containing protein [Cytobacillus gottheilii]
METSFSSYLDIKSWKAKNVNQNMQNTDMLNKFHDRIIENVVMLTIEKIGEPPCNFAFFLTGSGGRFEQGLFSDQDHGIIYKEDTKEANMFFLRLGEEISFGLNEVGYPYCEGNVMSSNPLWCKSLQEWRFQLKDWMEEASWASIRNLQIFYDARSLIGEEQLVEELKTFIHEYGQKHSYLVKRVMENVQHFKNSIGPLGQIIVEEKGKYHGCIDLKYSAFIPFVNAIRILAVKEGIQVTSTEARMLALLKDKQYASELKDSYFAYKALLQIRVNRMKDVTSYEDAHYLNVVGLSKIERAELKHILKQAKQLHQYVIALIEKV